jgi:hypothetical protein
MLLVHKTLKIQSVPYLVSYIYKTFITYCEMVILCETLNAVLLNFPMQQQKSNAEFVMRSL